MRKEKGSEVDITTLTDEQIQEIAGAFSYDLETCHKRLKAGDDWQRVIQAHLFFDHIVNRILSEDFKRPEEVNLDRMSFAAKIDLAASMGLIGRDIKGLLKRINGLRNDISHNLSFEVTEDHAAHLYKLSPRECRILIDEENEKPGSSPLHSCFLVNVIWLDIVRQGHVRRRLMERKQQSHLREAIENAKRVLDEVDRPHRRGTGAKRA